MTASSVETTLINRTTRRMDLTEEGKFFFERAKLILEQMDELEERLISHLTLNYAALSRAGVAGLQKMLALYDLPQSASSATVVGAPNCAR